MGFNLDAEGTGQATQSFLSKSIEPGKHKLKICELVLDHKKFEPSNGKAGSEGDYLIMKCETEPVEDEGFEGFAIDYQDESKGRYLGQSGSIKYSQSLYAGETRDQMLSAAVMTICRAAGIDKDLKTLLNGKSTTVEKVIEAINKKGLLKDQYIWMIVGGKEHYNRKGYLTYFLNLAYPKDEKKVIARLSEEDKLMTFDAASMIKKAIPTPITDFGQGDTSSDLTIGGEPIGITEDLGGTSPVDDLPF